MGFRVWGLGFKVQVRGLGLRVLWCGCQGFGFPGIVYNSIGLQAGCMGKLLQIPNPEIKTLWNHAPYKTPFEVGYCPHRVALYDRRKINGYLEFCHYHQLFLTKLLLSMGQYPDLVEAGIMTQSICALGFP